MSNEDIAEAKSYAMRYGNNTHDTINWEVLADNVHVTDDDLDQIPLPDLADVVVTDIDLKSALSIDTFFEHIFPQIMGHVAIMDEHLKDPCAKHHSTYEHNGIMFHDSKILTRTGR